MKTTIQLTGTRRGDRFDRQHLRDGTNSASAGEKGLKTVAAAGLTVQSGNSESVATTISLDTKEMDRRRNHVRRVGWLWQKQQYAATSAPAPRITPRLTASIITC